MKRKFLEDLGLEDEVVNKIMAENGKDLTELKAKVDDLNEQINVKETTIKQKNDKITELEKVDIEAIKKEQFNLGKAEGSKEVEDFKRQNAIDKVYNEEFEVDGKKYKVKDKKGLQGYLDNEKIKYENNQVSGLVEQFSEIVKTSPYLFETDTKNPQFADSTPGTNSNKDNENALRQAMGLEPKKD
nr:MAG TPA: minor structural protein [Caudoviricetes sp.]